MKDKKNKFPLIIVCIVLGFAIIGGGIFALIKVLENKKNTEKYDEVLGSINVDQYFKDNSEIKAVTGANKSKNLLSEKEAIKELESRGFKDYPVTTEYTINGEYGEIEVSSNSSDKHPAYVTYYLSSKNELWVISIIDGSVLATPSSYNIDHSENVAIVLSESEEVVSYDGSKNKFYRTIPNKDVLDVRVVDKIDAETIEKINLEG